MKKPRRLIAPTENKPLIVVVLGVSASGKSTVARELATQIDCAFEDGDDLHPAENIQKMRSGKPLNDADRAPWLDRVADWIYERAEAGENGVIVCSALKHKYRDRLRDAYPGLAFVLLDPPEEILRKRIRVRKGHFMPPSLLSSQLRTLERPDSFERAYIVKGEGKIEENCLEILTWLTSPSMQD